MVYETILDRPGGSVGEVSQSSRLSRAQAGRALGTLEAKGLITRSLSYPARFVPVAPDIALRLLLLRRQEQLERVHLVAQGLAERFQKQSQLSTGNLVEVVVGRDAMSHRVAQLWMAAQEELLQFDKPPYIMDPTQPNDVETEKLQQGVRVRAIYDQEALEIPGALADIQLCVTAGEEARTVAGLPMKLLVVDHHTGLVPLRLGESRFESAIIVYESPLLEALASLFNLFWELASPLPFASDATTAVGSVSDRLSTGFEQVLALLAAGHKEESIARALGITRRTVGRRIERMMSMLGVQTRFELGHKATVRGWLTGPTRNQ